MTRTAIVFAALLVAGCSGTASTSDTSHVAETDPRSSVPIASEVAAESTSASTSHAVESTTTQASTINLVPPADPSALIGRTTSTRQILSNPGSVPDSQLLSPWLLINGAETNLASYGGACIRPDCQHAVELLADSTTFINDGWPSSSYLILESFLDRDASGQVTWTIADVLTITDVPAATPVSLLTEDECMFPNLPSGWTPVATLVDWAHTPTTPSRIWAVDANRTELAELPIDPAWTCTQFTD